MNSIGIIFRRELKSYFNSPVAYIVILAFLGITHWLFFRTFFLANQSTLRPFFAAAVDISFSGSGDYHARLG